MIEGRFDALIGQGTTAAEKSVQNSVNRNDASAADSWQSPIIGLVVSIALLVALSLPSIAVAQTKKAQKSKNKSTQKAEPTLNDRLAKAKAEVISAAKDYKKRLEELLALQEVDVKDAAALVEKRKALLAQSVISKKELEESEQQLVIVQAKVKDTKGKIGEADNLMAEASAEDQLTKLGPGTYRATAALIRYNGSANWVLADAAKVQNFFALRFNHALPISAFGQTPVHDQLGFDHHNSIDVALSPDSAEGKTLMEYLRSAGIPFIAFRQAVPGSATGAHIHIGYPSKRIARQAKGRLTRTGTAQGTIYSMPLPILVVSVHVITSGFFGYARIPFASMQQDKRILDAETRSYVRWYDALKERSLPQAIKLGEEFLKEYPESRSSDYVRKIINFVRISLDEQKHAEAGELRKQIYASLSQETARLEALLNEALSGRVDVNARTEGGRNALMYAAATANAEAVGELLKKGADIDAVETTHAWSALTFAIWSKDRNVIIPLVGYYRQNKSLKDKEGRTALDHAVLTADFEIILLVNSGGGGDFGPN